MVGVCAVSLGSLGDFKQSCILLVQTLKRVFRFFQVLLQGEVACTGQAKAENDDKKFALQPDVHTSGNCNVLCVCGCAEHTPCCLPPLNQGR